MEKKSVETFSKKAENALLRVIVVALPVLYIFGGKIMESTLVKSALVLVPTATVTLVPEAARQMANTPVDMLPALVFGIVCIVLPTAIVLSRIYPRS